MTTKIVRCSAGDVIFCSAGDVNLCITLFSQSKCSIRYDVVVTFCCLYCKMTNVAVLSLSLGGVLTYDAQTKSINGTAHLWFHMQKQFPNSTPSLFQLPVWSGRSDLCHV